MDTSDGRKRIPTTLATWATWSTSEGRPPKRETSKRLPGPEAAAAVSGRGPRTMPDCTNKNGFPAHAPKAWSTSVRESSRPAASARTAEAAPRPSGCRSEVVARPWKLRASANPRASFGQGRMVATTATAHSANLRQRNPSRPSESGSAQ